MYGRIGDILQNYGRRGQTDGVNKWASWVRRERVWLPERNTNPNTVLENLKKPQFSRLLTQVQIFGGEDC